MLTFQKNFTLPSGEKADPHVLYFDIETTGLSAGTSSLYLIGCCYFTGKEWEVTQYFAESMTDEQELLSAFFDLLSHFSTLTSFNGMGFDIPYLTKCLGEYHLPYDFSGVETVDLFRTARRLSHFLPFPNLKQKSIEQFFSLGRDDTKTGGELIQSYETWLQTKDPVLLSELLLHNSDDVSNLPRLDAALSSYDNLWEETYTLAKAEKDDCLLLSLSFPSRFFFVPSSGKFRNISFSFEDNRLTFSFPFVRRTLKTFFADYKDYDYLPEEDMAISRKVSRFVPPERRKRATASTCYTKKEGCFIEQPSVILTPDFVEEYRGKRHFFEYKEEQPADVYRPLCDRLLKELITGHGSSASKSRL